MQYAIEVILGELERHAQSTIDYSELNCHGIGGKYSLRRIPCLTVGYFAILWCVTVMSSCHFIQLYPVTLR